MAKATSMRNQTPDLNEHKRKLFFENLSSKTTTKSLEEYLSGFQTQRCVVPCKDGSNQGHGSAIFYKESSVNTLMSKRPHRIDDRIVELYRSVPGQGSLKEKKGIKSLIVFGIKQGSLSKSDLEEYFYGFGKINHIDMNYGKDSCRIEFDDYDAVDKALLDIPHIIKQTRVNLEKGNRNNQVEPMIQFQNNQITSDSNNNSTMPKKSIMKQVKIDSRVSSVNIPEKRYCIHIKNLPRNVDAEILSKKFDWPIYNILMDSPLDDQSSSIECWLKDVDDIAKAKQINQFWNGETILGSKIECEIEEDKLELCNKFRLGKCPKSADVCDWQHIKCTADGKCSNDCPYGHAEGMKTGYTNDGSNERYRIKITGFQEKLTPQTLARILQFSDGQKCYVNRSQDQIGYIVQLRTIKYAKRLMAKWHNREIGGQTLQCQLELTAISSISRTSRRSGFVENREEENHGMHFRSRSCQRLDNIATTSRDSSTSRNDKNSEITVLDDRDINDGGRLFAQSRDVIAKQKTSDAKRKASSAEEMASFVHPKIRSSNSILQSEDITADARKSDGRQMSKIRKRKDHGSLASLIEYKDTYDGNYHRELNALQILKGMKGVVQLVDLDEKSNNKDNQRTSKCDFSIVTELAPGYSLKEFVNRIHHGGFTVLEAIQLTQNLITIVQHIYSRGVLHQDLEPENIMIEWDSKKTSIDQAQLTLINFSQARIKSDKNDQLIQSKAECWYKSPQANIELFKYSSTIDASSICAILLWLLTNTDPQNNHGLLPHERPEIENKLNRKITEAIRTANSNRKQPVKEAQLKTYLIDTFNIAFGYPQRQPWTIGDLECRIESIHELLLPRNLKMNSTDAIFQDLITTNNITVSISSDVHQDIFQKASNAFHQAKNRFCEWNQNQYSWSDGGCVWLDSTETSLNERRHDDILTYTLQNRNSTSRFSIIITSLAAVSADGNIITLSIGSSINGKMSRIPIGRYAKNRDYTKEFQDDFTSELNNLIISICKERKAIEQ